MTGGVFSWACIEDSIDIGINDSGRGIIECG